VTIFQWVGLPLVSLLFLRSGYQLVRGVRPRTTILVSLGIWLAAGVAIARPDVTTQVARLLGIGRGADLVIYLVAMAFLVSVFYFYHKYRQLSSELTEVVRSIALDRAQRADTDAAPKDDGPTG
jgi:hypothetical protein